jgi:hypothetical protein
MGRGKSYASRMAQAVCDASNEHDGAFRYEADMRLIAERYDVELDHLKRLVSARREERAAERELEEQADAKGTLDGIGEALESRGYAHMTNGQGVGDLLDQLDATKRALALAVDMLGIYEPGHSCAVSPEFVALAAVSTGDTSPEVMAIIDMPRPPRAPVPPLEVEITVS